MILPAKSENIILRERGIDRVIPYPKNHTWTDDFKSNWSRMLYYSKMDDKVYIFPVVSNMLLIYDVKAETLEGHEIKAPIGWDEDYIRNKVIRVQKQKKDVMEKVSIREGERYSLEEFIGVIQEMGRDRVPKGLMCGAYIYNSIKAL